MSGPDQDPHTRVAHLKSLSADELTAFVDGVLKEQGATNDETRVADPEGERRQSRGSDSYRHTARA